MNALERLLAPIGWQDFAERWLEQRPLHVAREDRRHFAELASLEAIETLLSVHEISFPELQLSRAEDPIGPADYTDDAGRIVAQRLLQHHVAGATIVLSRAHRRLPPLAALVRDVQARLGVPCQANLYLSPPDRQGFAPHYDAHDVYILQIAGAKRFAFYDGGPRLPFASQRFDPAVTQAGEKRLDIELIAGSTLYIPRGVMHDAIAMDDEPSLHVTLGTFAPTALEVLQDALQRAAVDDEGLRRSIRLDRSAGVAPSDPDVALDPLLALRDRLPTLLGGHRLLEAIDALAEEAALSTMPNVIGLVGELRATDAIGDHTLVRVRDEESHRVEDRDGRLVLRTSGSVVEFTGDTARAMRALLAAGKMRCGALALADAAARAALIARLVASGIVTTIQDAGPTAGR